MNNNTIIYKQSQKEIQEKNEVYTKICEAFKEKTKEDKIIKFSSQCGVKLRMDDVLDLIDEDNYEGLDIDFIKVLDYIRKYYDPKTGKLQISSARLISYIEQLISFPRCVSINFGKILSLFFLPLCLWHYHTYPYRLQEILDSMKTKLPQNPYEGNIGSYFCIKTYTRFGKYKDPVKQAFAKDFTLILKYQMGDEVQELQERYDYESINGTVNIDYSCIYY